MKGTSMSESMRLGGGGRFERLRKSLAGRKGVENPEALAAWIGSSKHGSERMRKWAAKGRKKGR